MQIIAKAYDNPIPGYKTATVGNLRLWEALPVDEFDLTAFNEGKYDKVSQPPEETCFECCTAQLGDVLTQLGAGACTWRAKLGYAVRSSPYNNFSMDMQNVAKALRIIAGSPGNHAL